MQTNTSSGNVRVSIVLLAYNDSKDLAECIPSLKSQTYPDYEIIIVDNSTTDEVSDFIKNTYPEIRYIKTGANLGYPAGNNIGAGYAKGKSIVIINPDTVVDVNWLKELVKPLDEAADVAITTSKILIYGQKDKINTCGNRSHYTGLDFCRGMNEDVSSYSKQEEVGAISGCSFAIKRDVFEELGGFDPDFFLYLEDTDLSWRVRLAGHKIIYVPTSIVYHKFKLSIAPWKEFYLERNRYFIIIKNYSLKTLFLLLPALLVTEVVTWGHAILHGLDYVINKIRAYIWIMTNLRKLIEKRHQVQIARKISDRAFMKLLDHEIPFSQVIENKALCTLASLTFNKFYHVYYKFIIMLL